MIPRTGIVACPGDRESLASRVGRTGQDKRPQVRVDFQQALVGRPRILHAIDIVNFKMAGGARPKSRFVDPMLNAVRHRQVGGLKDRGLVHVVPKARDTFRHEVLVESAPPLPCLLSGEVRKDGESRPHSSYVRRAIRILNEMIPGRAGVIRSIAGVGDSSDMQIGDRYDVKMILLQLRQHFGKMRKACFVHSEGAFFLLEINIEIEDVGGNPVRAQPRCDFAQSAFGFVAKPRLLKPQRP